MSVPVVSIILPTQGTRESLGSALRSALAQDFEPFEIIIVDDAMPGVDWRAHPGITPYLTDPRVRVVPFHQGRGCAAAKNAGWRAARGEWLCYLDDDNEYLPSKLRAQQACATRSRSPVVLCGVEILTKGRRRRKQTGEDEFSSDGLLLRTLADTNVLFHRRSAHARWNETILTVDDACFFQALVAEYGLKRVPNVPEALVYYHAHAGPRANRAAAQFYRGQRCLLVHGAKHFSPQARRVLLLRSLIAFNKFQRGQWLALAHRGWQLLRVGGWREWRVVVNAVGVKLPWLRDRMVT